MAVPERDSVNAIAADLWEHQLREHPEAATALGDHRFDDQLSDLSASAFARRAREARALARRLEALGPLAGEDAITADVLRVQLAELLDVERLHLEQIAIDQMDGPQITFPRLMDRHPSRDEADLRNLATRYRAFPDQMEQYVDNLRAGLRAQRTAPRVVVERVLAQLRDCLAEDPASSAFVYGRPEASLAELTTATRAHVFRGYRALLEFLERDYLPRARADVGLWAIPDGGEVYAYAIRQRTTVHQTPEALHALGERELARLQSELRAILGHAERRALEQWLAADPGFADREAMLDAHRSTVARFSQGLASGFSRLPPLQVAAIPEHLEAQAPALHYERPSEDGARPGALFVNTAAPEAQSRARMEALVAREAVPGRHLQVSLVQHPEALPPLRRRAAFPAFTDGWGLYAERLVDERGLYSDDRARAAMLLAEAARAARLLVDTGMHAMKWTREHAIEHLLETSAVSRAEAEAEIDRAIVWPAQGMAAAVGALEIRNARTEAELLLGPRFSLAAFHDRLLASGAMPLETMRRVIADWARGG